MHAPRTPAGAPWMHYACELRIQSNRMVHRVVWRQGMHGHARASISGSAFVRGTPRPPRVLIAVTSTPIAACTARGSCSRRASQLPSVRAWWACGPRRHFQAADAVAARSACRHDLAQPQSEGGHSCVFDLARRQGGGGQGKLSRRLQSVCMHTSKRKKQAPSL
jgi:hypothetical protein